MFSGMQPYHGCRAAKSDIDEKKKKKNKFEVGILIFS